MSNSIYGLQKMSSDHAEVRKLVGVLATKMSDLKEPLTEQSVAVSLYGMQVGREYNASTHTDNIS